MGKTKKEINIRKQEIEICLIDSSGIQRNNGKQKKIEGDIIESSETQRRKNKENLEKEILLKRADCFKDVQES